MLLFISVTRINRYRIYSFLSPYLLSSFTILGLGEPQIEAKIVASKRYENVSSCYLRDREGEHINDSGTRILVLEEKRNGHEERVRAAT